MPLFIDCYNLLHAPMPPSLAGLDELGLCRVLSTSLWAGDRVVVVCDGMPKPGVPAGSHGPGVQLMYSGPQRTADDVIIDMVERDSAPRRLYVVTNDREIQKTVKRRGVQVISNGAFIRALAASRPAGAKIDAVTRHRPALPEGEVNKWLQEFGIDPDSATLESVAASDERAADPRRSPLEHEPPPAPEPEQHTLDDGEVARWLKEFGIAPDEPIDPHHEKEWWEE